VLGDAEWSIVGTFLFAEVEDPQRSAPSAIALVRDGSQWSQLVPAGDEPDGFIVGSFHFPPGVDNSGFVGWLASRIKAEFGSGVAVICGWNPERGGIHDYWLLPPSVADQIVASIESLKRKSPTNSQKSSI
jgi:hypothetical protein